MNDRKGNESEIENKANELEAIHRLETAQDFEDLVLAQEITKVSGLGKGLSATLMDLLMFVIGLQIVARLIGLVIDWTEEVSRYLFIWLVLVGAGIAMQTGEHPFVEFFGKKEGRSRKYIVMVRMTFILIYVAVFVYVGIKETVHQWRVGNMAASLPLPIWTIYAAIPICCVLIGYNTIKYFRKSG